MKIAVKPEHEVAYQELCTLMSKHTSKLSPIEMLAIGANMVGKLAALQDQRKYTSEDVMTIIAENVKAGNEQVVKSLDKTKGNG